MTADPHIEKARESLVWLARLVQDRSQVVAEGLEALDALAARLEAAERDREALRDLDAFASNKAGYWQHPLTEKARRVLAEVAATQERFGGCDCCSRDGMRLTTVVDGDGEPAELCRECFAALAAAQQPPAEARKASSS